ncbi:MAG: hypothetical protein IH934_02995 [Nanoarchaeota archaeon]|nr:hypothetical protein [Nanoarchaeota archaeon]
MVSGKYGMELVNVLVPLGRQGSEQRYLTNSPVASIEVERKEFSIRILPLRYQDDINPTFALIKSENDQARLSVLGIGPDGDAEQTIDDLASGTGKELPDSLTQSFLPVSGDQASEIYEQLEGATPGTIWGLVATLRHYGIIEQNVHYERRERGTYSGQGAPWSGRREGSAIWSSKEMRRRLGRR